MISSVHCMGYRDNEPRFLNKFIDTVERFEYVSSDTLSSAIFYSLYKGKKSFYEPSSGNIITDNGFEGRGEHQQLNHSQIS